MDRTVYLDNNATTRIAPEVKDVMLPFFGELYGNPSSMHAFGGQVAKYVDRAREEVARFINASPEEIIFTSCATESDNAAIRGYADFHGRGTKIITSAVEHPAVLQPCRRLKALGHEVVELGVDGFGRLNIEQLREELKGTKNALVSAMWANNETGTVFPIEKIADIVKECGAIFHTDAVQAVCHIPVNVKDDNIDMLSLSAHKFHGPKGVGVLYAKRGTLLTNLIEGGAQERGKRAGTENIPAILSMAAAMKEELENMEAAAAKIIPLRDKLIAGLSEIPHSRLNGDREQRVPGTVNFCFEGIEGESLLLMLDEEGIQASSGSACTSGSLDPSHVLLSLGLPHEVAHGSLRLSITEENTEEQIDHILNVVPKIVSYLRDISPVWEALETGERPHLL
jgi:cysteine desulfurase